MALLDAYRRDSGDRMDPPFLPGSPEADHNRNNSNYLAPTPVTKYHAIGRALV